MAASHSPLPQRSTAGARHDARDLVLQHGANELIFGVVGHVGSGTSEITRTLNDILSEPNLEGGAYDVRILSARDVIAEWAGSNDEQAPESAQPSLQSTEEFQDLGDKMRSRPTTTGEPDLPAVARGLILRIRQCRAELQGHSAEEDAAVVPDGTRRAYILDSLRHPAEVQLLRHIYQDAFVLIGVVCEAEKRLSRLVKKYSDAGEGKALAFMRRDAEAKEVFGQHVADTFHLSDFFVDNTADRLLQDGTSNKAWDTNDKLSRLVKILTHSEIVRPEMPELAMHHAYGAMKQSACLSRQVGAALADQHGNIVATGTNEVPKAGGGVYGESFSDEAPDDRCAFRTPSDRRYCSNTREQNQIVEELIDEVPELAASKTDRRQQIASLLRRTRIGSLLEFSRAVHAEMDALLSAARQGISPVGARLFVTTFPCHYCARHLVGAGVDEVQYIEPYPKSQALELHSDAIQTRADGWKPPSQGGRKVLFRPFSGVAPRLFSRAFRKDRDLKNKGTGLVQIGEPSWATPWHLRKVSYVDLEVSIVKAGL